MPSRPFALLVGALSVLAACRSKPSATETPAIAQAKENEAPAATNPATKTEESQEPKGSEAGAPDAAVEIDDTKSTAEWIAGLGEERSKRYLRITLEATLRRQTEGLIKAKVSCAVGSKKMVASGAVIGVQLSKMKVGETSKGHVAFWALDPLDEPGKSCELTLSVNGDDFYVNTITWK